jgi:hypothetical protein
MESILDKLLLGYFYVYILCCRLEIIGVSVQRTLMLAFCVATYVYLFVAKKRIPGGVLIYCVMAHIAILALAVIGLVEGNQAKDIVQFVLPIQILLIIPGLILLINKYGAERYIRHLTIAGVLLAVFVLGIYVACEFLGRSDIGDLITFTPAFGTTVGYTLDGIRISPATGLFLAVALTFVCDRLIRERTLFDLIYFCAILTALYVTKTMSIISAAAVGVCLVGISNRKGQLLLWLFIIIIAYVQVRYWRELWSDSFFAQKVDSIAQKQRQMELALDIFRRNPIFGQGIGYIYSFADFDAVSGGGNLYLEASYAMVLASGGLIGVGVYAYIYLYYPVKGLFSFRQDNELRLFLIAVAVMLCASAGQPYFWTASALLFGCFVAALLHADRPETRWHPAYGAQ